MFQMPISSPMMTTMLGRCDGVWLGAWFGTWASAGALAISPAATVDARSLDSNGGRFSSLALVIVCPLGDWAAAKGCQASCTIRPGCLADYADSAKLRAACAEGWGGEFRGWSGGRRKAAEGD